MDRSIVPTKVLPYAPPVSPESFLSIWIVLLTAGVVSTGLFF